MKGFYGTQEHQDLVMEVMNHSTTGYMEKWNCYMTLFFTCKEHNEHFSRIEDEDLEVFTDKVRAAAAKFLELDHLKNEKTK